ncbi:DUF397 domain-containing protein [Sphaerisporangium aureirubrum]|uniref:DUF397 domain-containing protein n=1 Tax=Sphaerisporangium aureirubrum TaxID=1544736 RepID=A0ABW1NJC9_9ACTN
MSEFGIGIEVGAALSWMKSSFSSSNGECLECATVSDGAILVRDSKRQTGPVITCTPTAWRAFVAGVRDGRFGA